MTTDPDNLTLAVLNETTDRVRLADCLVYAVSEEITTGKVIQVVETDWYYEYFIFHSEDEAQAMAVAAGLKLLHVRNAPMKAPPRIKNL